MYSVGYWSQLLLIKQSLTTLEFAEYGYKLFSLGLNFNYQQNIGVGRR
jgi:hypothetical protein